MAKILIVGASKGVGAAIVTLARPEFEVISLSRTQPQGDVAEFHLCDVLTDPLPSIDEPLAGLVYCPGSIILKPFKNLQCQDFVADLELNLIGAVRCLKHYQSNLQRAHCASVVLFSSVAVQIGMPYHAVAAASKGAVEGLVRALAAEWAPTIRVNALAPSLTETGLSERLLADDHKRQALASRHPMKRVGRPDDIAQAALFLLSEKSSWITGQVLHVDGGLSTLKI